MLFNPMSFSFPKLQCALLKKFNLTSIVYSIQYTVRFIFSFIFQVKDAYIYFLIHCYVDTEVEMKEVYTSHHIWALFDNFLLDMARVGF